MSLKYLYKQVYATIESCETFKMFFTYFESGNSNPIFVLYLRYCFGQNVVETFYNEMSSTSNTSNQVLFSSIAINLYSLLSTAFSSIRTKTDKTKKHEICEISLSNVGL